MLTVSDISELTGVKKSGVSCFLSRHGIKPVKKNGRNKYFDESAEPLASYLGGGKGGRRRARAAAGKNRVHEFTSP